MERERVGTGRKEIKERDEEKKKKRVDLEQSKLRQQVEWENK